MDADDILRQLQAENEGLRRQMALLQQQLAAAQPPPPLQALPGGAAPPAEGEQGTTQQARWKTATLEALFEALPDYIFVVERDTMRIPFCNSVFARGIGYPDYSAIEGLTIYECFPPESAARFARQNERVFTTGVTLHEIEQIDLPDGTHHFDTYKIPVAGPDGTIIGLLGTSREITDLVETRQALARLNAELEGRIALRTAELQVTNARLAAEVAERRATEEALRASETRYRLISEHSGDLILLLDLDADGVVLYASPSHLQVLGYIPTPGSLGTAFVHPDDMAEAQRVSQESAELGIGQGTLRILAADGTYRWIEGRVSSFVQDGRRLAVSVAHDITDRRRLEAQLFQAQKLEGIGRLAGGVAHDFNNLLVVISGSAELARQSLPDTHPAQDDLREIQRAAGRAAGLTRQLLAFARREVSDPQTLDLNTLITDLRRLLRRLVREDIVLVEALAPDSWPVRGDPGQLEQVIVNLVVNAQDAMPRGGTITIETANVVLDAATAGLHPQLQQGRYVLLAVTDTGTGMSEAVLRQAFDPFFTTKPPGQGTGLGLSTCYGIVTQHGGGIYLYSEPGHGTAVKVYLPPSIGPALEAEAVPHPNAQGGDETLLLVEDESSVRALAARVLREQGYTVLEAASGPEALQLVAGYGDRPIHLLLTDTVMPGMSGPALAEQLLLMRPDLKLLVMSGYINSTVIEQPPLPGAIHQLQKPFTPLSLARAVRAVLDASGEA